MSFGFTFGSSYLSLLPSSTSYQKSKMLRLASLASYLVSGLISSGSKTTKFLSLFVFPNFADIAKGST